MVRVPSLKSNLDIFTGTFLKIRRSQIKVHIVRSDGFYYYYFLFLWQVFPESVWFERLI